MAIKKTQNSNFKQNFRGIILAIVVSALTAILVSNLNLITP